MTKTLTEQWRDGTLDGGYYYIKTRSWGCDDKWHIKKGLEIDYYNEEVWSIYEDYDIYCVVAPVPSYDHFSQLVKKVERLQEQLKEANELLQTAGYGSKENMYPFPYVCPEECRNYLKKWGIK